MKYPKLAQSTCVAASDIRSLQPVRMADAISDSMALLKPVITSAWGIRLEIDDVHGVWCMAVPAELQSCIINIVKNAVEHGFRGRSSGTIIISTGSSGGMQYLCISNDGAQIPEGIAADLLKAPLRSSCNNGIGLYVAAQSLRSFGADLEFESGPEKTTFTIWLLPVQGGTG